AWHVFSGLWFLLRNPGLWPLAALPALLAAGGILLGVVLGAFSIRWFEESVLPTQGSMSPIASLLLTLAFWAGAMAAGILAGLALALMLASPVLDLLSRRVEERQNGGAPAVGAGLRWEILEAAKGIGYFLAAAPVVLIVSLIPLVGAPIALLWGSHALALQQTDPALTRRGLAFKARRGWHKRYRAESLGFGVAGWALLLIPFANLLLLPALTVGATRLVMELEPAADGRPRLPVPPAAPTAL
ncbi:MAG: EI24 domain-containing protein, partial [Vicinamibacteria bacterium]